MNFLISILLLTFLSACSTTVPEGYRETRMSPESSQTIRDLHIELLVLDSSGQPIDHCEIRAETMEYIDNEITNSQGITQVHLQRAGSERLRFSFTTDDFTSEYIMSNLPEGLKNVGLAFKIQKNGTTKLLSYTSDR